MAEASIPVDLRNPGQVFACLGLMEAAEVLLPRRDVFGQYFWDRGATLARFTIGTSDDSIDPVREVVEFLAHAEVRALNAPARGGVGVMHSTDKWHVVTQPFDRENPYSFPVAPPESPAPLPIELVDREGRSLGISHWGDDLTLMGRDNVKFWAGSGGYPGAALARDALALFADLDGAAYAEAAADPFGVAAPQSSSFSFDWRRSYVPLDAGFSPNAHADVRMVGYPLVELLAALGLQNARPERPEQSNKLTYRYAVSNARLPILFARAVLGGEDIGFEVRRFRVQLGWPGQEGQARCIIDSREE